MIVEVIELLEGPIKILSDYSVKV